MSTLTIQGVELGAGRAKIIVPIVGNSREDILREAAALQALPVDLVEWRADFYQALSDEAALLETARSLREALGELPLLFTIRTKREGGKAELGAQAYAVLNLAIARSGCADLVDAELSAEGARAILDGVHAAGCLAVGSRHHFDATPPQSEMVAFLREAQALGADIPKLAVMPQCDADVLTLLSASAEFRDRYADRPFVTISMGARGVLSRIACDLSGSCMTFASASRASAPGQIPVAELAKVLNTIHNAT